MKKNIILTMAVILILLALGSCIYFSKVNSATRKSLIGSDKEMLPVVRSSANYISYETADELINSSQLIVIASTVQKFEERKPLLRTTDGTISSFCTQTDIKVKKILKKPDNLDLDTERMLTILEPAALLDDTRGKRILVIEDFSPMIENNDYILFLRANDQGVYSIINMFRGIYNLSIDEDVTPRLNKLNELDKKKFHDMKKDVAKKFSLTIKEKD